MAHKNLKVLDSDIHIIEPPDLWQRYIDPAFRDRAPQGLTEDAGRPAAGVERQAVGARRRGRRSQPAPARARPCEEPGALAAVPGARLDAEGPARGDGHRGHRRRGDLSIARPVRPGHPRHGPATRRRDGARLQRLALRVLPGEPRAPARRRHDLAVRRRRRRGGGAPLCAGAGLPRRLPAAERGERPELARSLLRAPVGRARGARGAARIPRGRRLAAPASRRAVRRTTRC